MVVRRTVFVIADSDQDAQKYQCLLQQDGRFESKILSAQHRTPGLDYPQLPQVDVILLRIASLDSDRFDLLRQFTEKMGDRCPPIVVIGNDAAEMAVRAFKQGSTDYLIADRITPDQLYSTLECAIEQNKHHWELERRQKGFQISIENMLDYFSIFSAQVYATQGEDSLFASWGNVTEYEHLEQQLEQVTASLQSSLQRYQDLAEAMPSIVWTADATGTVNYWNQRWYDYTGLSQSESMGLLGVSTVHPDERHQTLERWQQSITHGEPFEIEYRIRRWDGVYHWFICRAIPTRDAQNQITGWIGSIADIDELKLSETRIRQNEQQLQRQLAEIEAIYQTAPVGLNVLDPELRFVRINQRLAEINGFPVEAHIGRTIRELLPDLADAVDSPLRTVLETGEPLLNVEVHGETPAQPGVRRTWLEHFIPLKQGDRVVGISTVCEEITERMQVEAALRQSEDRLRMAIESAQLGTWDWNLITNELIWDAGCKAIFGFPVDAEINIEEFFKRVHPEDRDRLERVVQWSCDPASGGNYDVEYRTIRLRDGLEHWIAAKGQVYFDTEGHPQRFIGTVLDITAQKYAEAQREQLLRREQAAREEAERANRIKDEFLAILSHELRSPLNPILGWAKLLQTRRFDDETTAQALAIIERNAKLQAQLIDDLLDIARILRGKLSLNKTAVNLVTVIEAAIDTVRTTAEAKSITLHPMLPCIGQVAGDAARLQQIVWNLLSNAIKFTPEHGRVDIHLAQVGNQAQITVRDTGKGISPSFLPHIFESFRQEDASTTRKYGGLGLGLAIVRQLVEAHEGSIEADSPGEGAGATFTVQLPLLSSMAPLPQGGVQGIATT